MLWATSVFDMVEFKFDFKICMPYFAGDQLSVSCLKYMEVVILLFSDKFSD